MMAAVEPLNFYTPAPRIDPNGGPAANGEPGAPPPFATRLVRIDPSWLAEAPPAREYLATDTRTGQGALDAVGVTLLVAAGGVGKSYATVALALAVSTGGMWLDTFRVKGSGRVLLISAEEPADEIRRRLYHVARPAGVKRFEHVIDVLDLHDVHAPLLDEHGPTAWHERIVELVREHGPYALVVDPLGRVAGQSIDADNVAAGSLISALEAIASAARGLVLAVHHTSKVARRERAADATAIRGATGLGDYARMVLLLNSETVKFGDAEIDVRLGEIVTLVRAKANHVPRWEPVELRRGEHGELLALDAPDRERVRVAREQTASGAERVRERETVRSQVRQAREVEERERKATRKAERDAEDAARLAREDQAARAILAKHGSGLTWRGWQAEMRARLGKCSTERAAAARVRVSS